MLSSVGLCVPDIVHELVIDPRNDIEHEYTVATREQAKRAIELADLFIRATDEGERFAIVNLGSSLTFHWIMSRAPGNEYDRLHFNLLGEPMLLVDARAPEPHVIVLYPPRSELITCGLRDFKRDEAVELAKLLRRQREFQSSFDRISYREWLPKLKADLGLSILFS
jgi:hypothetical protein